MNFARVAAQKRMKELQPDKGNDFKVSEGWFHRFAKRKNVKFRKRKSRKKHDGEVNLDKVSKVNAFSSCLFVAHESNHFTCTQFYSCLRHAVLSPREGANVSLFTLAWGSYLLALLQS